MFPGTENRLGYSGMCEDQSVCRDYLRNVCKRGKKCKFKHPSLEECERLRGLSQLPPKFLFIWQVFVFTWYD
ncbi:Zinc finger CCCH domain-containing protein [Schistosoma japonicum]|uniref:Zinc finger CCCH domain-containing protein n=1 Tax=Schistosoma japonicum TaxID=6182 RepID=A0A4Z2D2J1_SCHJA|nr:Zinc finger CCCH domain-containing protein [Schistosoma japonicum]